MSLRRFARAVFGVLAVLPLWLACQGEAERRFDAAHRRLIPYDFRGRTLQALGELKGLLALYPRGPVAERIRFDIARTELDLYDTARLRADDDLAAPLFDALRVPREERDLEGVGGDRVLSGLARSFAQITAAGGVSPVRKKAQAALDLLEAQRQYRKTGDEPRYLKRLRSITREPRHPLRVNAVLRLAHACYRAVSLARAVSPEWIARHMRPCGMGDRKGERPRPWSHYRRRILDTLREAAREVPPHPLSHLAEEIEAVVRDFFGREQRFLPREVDLPRGFTLPPTMSDGAPDPTLPFAILAGGEVRLEGRPPATAGPESGIDDPIVAPLKEVVEDEQRFARRHPALPFRAVINLFADAAAPSSLVIGIARAARAAGFRHMALIGERRDRAPQGAARRMTPVALTEDAPANPVRWAFASGERPRPGPAVELQFTGRGLEVSGPGKRKPILVPVLAGMADRGALLSAIATARGSAATGPVLLRPLPELPYRALLAVVDTVRSGPRPVPPVVLATD